MKARYSSDNATSDHLGKAWFGRVGSSARDDAGLVSSLGRELRSAGLMIDGLVFHVATLHPDVFARVIAWSPNGPVKVYERDHPVTVSAGFPGSQFRHSAHGPERQMMPLAISELASGLTESPFGKREMSEAMLAPIYSRSGRAIVASFWLSRPLTFTPQDHIEMARTLAFMRNDRRWREDFGLELQLCSAKHPNVLCP